MKIIESETTETKKSIAQLRESLKSISAILNKHQKGTLYFGIDPIGNPVKNIHSEKTLRDISQVISDNIEPKIYPSISLIKYNNVYIIKVAFEGSQTPYAAEGRYYIRVADEDKQMSSEELKKFFLNNKDQRWDSSPNPSAALKDIDSKKVKDFCKIAGIKFTNLPDVLESLNIYKNGRLLNAAIALFAKSPNKYFPNIFLSCAVFATDTASTIIDQKNFEGDLLYLMEEAEKYIIQNIHIGMTVNGLYLKDIPELDQEALREAIKPSSMHSFIVIIMIRILSLLVSSKIELKLKTPVAFSAVSQLPILHLVIFQNAGTKSLQTYLIVLILEKEKAGALLSFSKKNRTQNSLG